MSEQHYINPYSAFEAYLDPGIPVKDQLVSLRKKLLAELDLSDTKSLFLAGNEYTKDTLLKLFESFKNSNHWKFYEELEKDPDLSYFLSLSFESGKFKFRDNPIYDSPEFVDFISPYFRNALVDYVVINFNYPNSSYLNYIFANTKFLNPVDKLHAYAAILDSLNGVVQRLENYIRIYGDQDLGVNSTDEGDILGITSSNFIMAINSLPPDFSSFVREYSIAAINLSVGLNEKNAELKRSIINDLFLIDVDADIKNVITGNYKALHRPEEKGEGAATGWLILRVVLIAIYALTRLSHC